MASSPHEKYLAVTVKEERYVTGLTQYPPLLSPLLVKRIPRGTRLVVTGFTGPYTLPDDIESKHRPPRARVRGLGQRAQLRDPEVRAAPPSEAAAHLRLLEPDLGRRDLPERPAADGRSSTPTACKPPPHPHPRAGARSATAADVRAGRIGIDLLREVIPDPTACRVFACGPAITVYDRKAAREERDGARPALPGDGAGRPEDARREERADHARVVRLATRCTPRPWS